MDLNQFYACGYWHYHSAFVHALRAPFPLGTESSVGCLSLIIPLSDPPMFPSQGLQVQFVKETKGLHTLCWFLLHPSCLPLLQCQQQPTLLLQCMREQGTWLGAQQRQGAGSGRQGAKEAEDYGNVQETAKHTSCFQEAQQRGNTDSLPCAKPWRN